MFRKASSNVEALDEDDCHRQLRIDHGANIKDDNLCVSIAFDWLFLGHTKEGMQREIMWSLVSAIRNRREMGARLSKEKKHVQIQSINSLGQTELGLLFSAAALTSGERPERLQALGPILDAVIIRQLEIIKYAETMAAAQGEVIKVRARARAKAKAAKAAKEAATAPTKAKGGKKGGQKEESIDLHGLVTLETLVPDARESDLLSTVIDPYTTDFECRYCASDLPNCYFHCNVS
jgi:hypothetical protein